jgi:type II secretory pathway pseudopilin PulG
LKRRAGFMLPELIFALALIVAATAIWTTSAAHVRRADRVLADSRDAMRLAEQTLIALRAGEDIPKPPAPNKVTIDRCQGGVEVAGHVWVYVEATVANQRRGLTGLVPETALKRGGL